MKLFRSRKAFAITSTVALSALLLSLFQNATVATALTTTNAQENEIYQYLVPDVCLDKNGVQTAQNPLNSNPKAAECERTRKMAPGDFFPYSRTGFLPQDSKHFNESDPSYNPQGNRVFVFPISSKYDVTDQNNLRSTTIIQWQSRPLNDRGDQDRFASLHPFYDTMNLVTVRNGMGHLLGGLGMPKILKADALLSNQTKDACLKDGNCYERGDWMISYNLSGGQGLLEYKDAKSPKDKGYYNDGVALHESAWSFPQRKVGGVFKVPAFETPLYETVAKRTIPIEVDDNNNPIIDKTRYPRPTTMSLGILSNVGRFRFGPGNEYGRVPGKRLNNYMETLVHFGFAKANKFGDGPARPFSEDLDVDGRPYQNYPGVSERTYLTKELGYNTRWELWRGVNIVRKNWDENEAAAIKAYSRQNCSIPANIAAGGQIKTIDARINEGDESAQVIAKGERVRMVTPHFAASNVLTLTSELQDPSMNGKPYYAQYFYVLDSKGQWHRTRWVMAGCHDSSNLKTNYVNTYIDTKRPQNSVSSEDQVLVYPEKVPGVIRCSFLNIFRNKQINTNCQQ